jgi:mutator protein MutT
MKNFGWRSGNSTLPHDMDRIEAAIAIVARDGKILVCQRKDDDALGGYWEFPGGKCEDGETLEQCLARELREEVDIVAHPIARLTPIEHSYPHAQVRLHPFLCEHRAGEPKCLECQRAIWIDPMTLRDYQFPPANNPLTEEVIAYFTAAAG